MQNCVTPLFVPGATGRSAPRQGGLLRADAMIITLRTRLPPLARRRPAPCFATQRIACGHSHHVRVNAVNTAWHREDLAVVAQLPISGIMLAKSEFPRDVEKASEDTAGKPIIALIETALGLSMAREIAAAACVRRLAFLRQHRLLRGYWRCAHARHCC